MKKKKILIVEDVYVVALEIKNILENLNYEVPAIVSTGEDAIKKALDLKPDLILMDIILEGKIDGIETAKEIVKYIDVPIIYLTANADNSTIKRARSTEPYGYLNKPLNKLDVYSNVDSALNKHTLEKKIRKSEEMYRKLVDTIPHGIKEIDTKGIILYANPGLHKLYEYDDEYLMGKSIFDFVATDSKRKNLKDYMEILVSEQPYSAPYFGQKLTKSGRVIDVYVTWCCKHDDQGNLLGFILIITDYTDIMKKKELEKEIVNISEKERQAIAYELHDNLGQDLTGANYLLLALKDKINQKLKISISDLDEVSNLIGNAAKQTKILSKGLSPVSFKEGIKNALHELSKDTEKLYNIKCHFNEEINLKIDDTALITNIYYITKEAIHNSVKHAGAENIMIFFRSDEKGIELIIEDDGKLNNKKSDSLKGMGLSIMKHRAELIGADFEIKNDESGFSVILRKDYY